MAGARTREAAPGDHSGVMALRRRHGMREMPAGEWLHGLGGPPGLAPLAKPRPIGWVVESESGEIVGFLGSVPLGYRIDGREAVAAAMNAWVVDEPYRASSLLLMRAFLRQDGVDLALNTTANAAAGRALEALRFARIPVRDADRCLFWICEAVGFAASALRSRRVPAARVLAPLAALGLRARRAPRAKPGTPEIEPLAAVDARFDALWEELGARPGVQLRRDRAQLAWALSDSLARGDAAILAASRSGRTVGYAVLLRHDAPEIGLRRFRLADLQAAPSAGEGIASALVDAAIGLARGQRIHVLEAVGFGAGTRSALEALGPRSRPLPAWPFYYKPVRTELGARLAQPDAWDPCQMDGDAFLQ